MTLPLFTLKAYRQETLSTLRRFLEKTVEPGDADTAFYAIIRRPRKYEWWPLTRQRQARRFLHPLL